MKKVAYLILAHQYPNQLARLVKSLDSPASIIFIHLDSKADINVFKSAIDNITLTGKVSFLSNRLQVIRFGFNMIRATLEGLKAIVSTGEEFSHITLLSGQDYPIKNIELFHGFLEGNPQKSLLDNYQLPFKYWNGNGGLDRVHYYHLVFSKFHFIFPILSYVQTRLHNKAPVGIWKIVHLFFKLVPTLNKKPRKFFPNMLPYGGSQWWTLSTEAVRYILDYLKDNPSFFNYFKYTYIPDETFFQTLLLNCPNEEISSNIINRNFRHIVFKQGEGSPKNLTIDDLKELLESDRFFARKFDIEMDSQIMDKLDEINALVEK